MPAGIPGSAPVRPPGLAMLRFRAAAAAVAVPFRAVAVPAGVVLFQEAAVPAEAAHLPPGAAGQAAAGHPADRDLLCFHRFDKADSKSAVRFFFC